MWIFLNNAFLSIVEHRDEPQNLMVRARIKGDIERTFPSAKVKTTKNADYRYRAVIPKAEVAEVIADAIRSIDYDNFKNSVTGYERHHSYFGVWHVMNDHQARTH